VNKSGSDPNLDNTAGFLGGLIRQARLGWRLFKDGRVRLVKLIPVAGLVYCYRPSTCCPTVIRLGD
jgi:hypothetical protein